MIAEYWLALIIAAGCAVFLALDIWRSRDEPVERNRRPW
jgi:hypothetical protein